MTAIKAANSSACALYAALGSCAVLVALTPAAASAAEDDLRLFGSERVRYEALDGQFRPGAPAAEDVVSLRTILTGEYAKAGWRVGAELYDSRAYGGERGGALSANDVNALELVQAYVARDFKDAFGAGSRATLEAGRFTMNLGSRRLVAADDYRNTTSGWTGLRLDGQGAGGSSFTLFYTLPQVRRPDVQSSVLDNRVVLDRESFDLRFWGAAAAHPLGKGFSVDAAFYGLDERDAPRRPNRDRRLRTLDARIVRETRPHSFDVEVEAAYQFGTISASAAPAAPRLDVSAEFVHLDGGYQFGGAWKPRLSVEYDWVSGDDAKASFGRFDTLFGMRGGDFGPSGIYAALGRANMSSPGVRLELTRGSRFDAFFVYRGLWTASRTDSFSTTGIRDASGASGSYAGQQVETRLRYWLKPKALRLDVSGAVLFKGRLLERAPNAPRTGDTHYVAVALSGFF
jgi:hypothetical protein